VWVHDASLATTIRRGGAHDAVPDPSYQPQRARIVLLPDSSEQPWEMRMMVAGGLVA
jgi:hypothetical protein